MKVYILRGGQLPDGRLLWVDFADYLIDFEDPESIDRDALSQVLSFIQAYTKCLPDPCHVPRFRA